jgi:hypothetical protein
LRSPQLYKQITFTGKAEISVSHQKYKHKTEANAIGTGTHNNNNSQLLVKRVKGWKNPRLEWPVDVSTIPGLIWRNLNIKWMLSTANPT